MAGWSGVPVRLTREPSLRSDQNGGGVQAWSSPLRRLGWTSEANRPSRASTGLAVIHSSAHFPVRFFCSVLPTAAEATNGMGLSHSAQERSCQRSKCWLSRQSRRAPRAGIRPSSNSGFLPRVRVTAAGRAVAAEVDTRWRGSYGYLTAIVEENGQDVHIPLCRIEYLGDDETWGFALYSPATDTYTDAVLRTGHPTGTAPSAPARRPVMRPGLPRQHRRHRPDRPHRRR